MTKVYACLIGNWVCLNDDPECRIGSKRSTPAVWLKDGGEVYSPANKELQNSLNGLDYVEVFYGKKDYKINPIYIQIVKE